MVRSAIDFVLALRYPRYPWPLYDMMDLTFLFLLCRCQIIARISLGVRAMPEISPRR